MKKDKGTFVTDYDILKQHHKFIEESDDDDGSTWEQRMTKAYNDNLYKEFVLCSLKYYRDGKVGLRWRIASEVISGKGESSCGNLDCSEEAELTTLEVDFEYLEEGKKKKSLVKIRLCPSCCSKFCKARKHSR